MNQFPSSSTTRKSGKRFGCLSVFGIMLLTIAVTVGVTYWLLFPKGFTPVELSQKEEQVLEKKLAIFEGISGANATSLSSTSSGTALSADLDSSGTLQPEAYSEEGGVRKLGITEREINAILAKNTDLADKVAIDLADRLISAKLRLPMEEDFPLFGGKILKARAGLEIAYENERPVVILKGVSVMGVPVPSAWLGGLKNIDLVKEFGQGDGFWSAFAEGIEQAQVVDGMLNIQLKE